VRVLFVARVTVLARDPAALLVAALSYGNAAAPKRVLCARDDLKVYNIHATPIAAQVVDCPVVIVWDGSANCRPHGAMHNLALVPPVDRAVTAARYVVET